MCVCEYFECASTHGDPRTNGWRESLHPWRERLWESVNEKYRSWKILQYILCEMVHRNLMWWYISLIQAFWWNKQEGLCEFKFTQRVPGQQNYIDSWKFLEIWKIKLGREEAAHLGSAQRQPCSCHSWSPHIKALHCQLTEQRSHSPSEKQNQRWRLSKTSSVQTAEVSAHEGERRSFLYIF